MHFKHRLVAVATVGILGMGLAAVGAPIVHPKTRPVAPPLRPQSTLESRLRTQMQALAGDSARGRGSGTPDELRAGQYIARQLQAMGVQPAGDTDAAGRRSFIQACSVPGAPGEDAAPAPKRQTWNVLGFIAGAPPKEQRNGQEKSQSREVILLSAHMDHLGVREVEVGQDGIYNGTDDDASGCVAVLELARSLARGARSRRAVYVAFFGSEESGGWGARYFLEHLPFEKSDLVANLEFEMIGRADPAVASDELWLTGYDRSDLGPTLARQGARLVPDPHPEQNFFMRSDNYALARQGVVAHTVSSFGLHPDYHQASDDIAHIDFPHMARAIASLEKPVRWLANSSFKPVWNSGQQP
jgi:hypothetical protein